MCVCVFKKQIKIKICIFDVLLFCCFFSDQDKIKQCGAKSSNDISSTHDYRVRDVSSGNLLFVFLVLREGEFHLIVVILV